MKKSNPTGTLTTPVKSNCDSTKRLASAFLKQNKLILLIVLLQAGCSKHEAEVRHESDIAKNSTATVSTTPGHYTIASYNVRRTTTDDTGNRAWSVRRALVKSMILTHGFDIFGVQEPMGPQIDNMIADLSSSGYAKFGVSDHNDHAYQHQDIFYKTAKFTLLASGKFWMAPNGPTTHSCNGTNDYTPWPDDYYHACVCTWGKFQDKATGQMFYVFNTHFDPGAPGGGVGAAPQAKLGSANVMLSKISEIAGTNPVIFMGDLNTDQNYPPYAALHGSTLLDETWEIAGTVVPAAYRQTGNWWNPYPYGQSQIDHIFVSNQWIVTNRTVHWDNYDNINGANDVLPSDHFPVSSDMKLPAPVNLTPTDDAYGRDGVPYGDQNFGAVSELIVKSAPSAGYTRRSALKFDLTGVPSVSQAILRVYGQNKESTAAVSINVQSAGDAWDESTVTWNNNFPSGSYIGTTSVSATPKYYDWDVTDFVKSQVAGDKLASFVMYQATYANLTMQFNSKESTSNKPVLVITP